VAEQLFAAASKRWVFIYIKDSWKSQGIWSMDFLSHLSKNQKQRWDYSWKVCGGASCPRKWNLITYRRPTWFLRMPH
jgi:hypothetical protein